MMGSIIANTYICIIVEYMYIRSIILIFGTICFERTEGIPGIHFRVISCIMTYWICIFQMMSIKVQYNTYIYICFLYLINLSTLLTYYPP